MCRRGLTLLEVLIAIGLALALLALALPPLTGVLERRAFQAAADTTLHQLLLARAHAQSTGQPVEAIYHDRRNLLEARRFEPGVDADLPTRFDADAGLDEAPDAWPADETDERAIPEGWAICPLPATVRLVDRLPDDFADRPPPEAGVPIPPVPPASRLIEADGAPLRLAVFMPDGSALIGRDVYLVDDDGRTATVSVNAWTGLPAVEIGVLDPDPDASAAEPDPDDEPVEPDADDWSEDRPDASGDSAAPADGVDDPPGDPDLAPPDEDEDDDAEGRP